MDGQLLSYDVRLPITSRLHHPKSYWVASRPKMSSNIRQSISLVALTAIFVKWLHGLVDDSFVTATWIFPDGFPTASRWEDLLRLRYFLLYVNSAVFKKRRKLFRNLSIKKRLLNLGSVFPGRVLKKKRIQFFFFCTSMFRLLLILFLILFLFLLLFLFLFFFSFFWICDRDWG